MVGLGRMGGNMAQRLLERGHDVVAFDLQESAREAVRAHGATTVDDLEALKDALTPPRVAWVMVSANATTTVINKLTEILDEGDVIVDGGNSNFRDSIARYEEIQKKGISFIDAGTSGGIWGLTEGYCLMVGGDKQPVELARPIFESLAPPNGFAHVGGAGAGHFAKMVHNGIEYGMMQAYAEGFELMQAMPEYDIDLHSVAELWRNGSVVRSWLLDLLADSLADKEGFEQIRGYVEDSGEGRWTVQEAVTNSVPMPVITASLFARFESRQPESFAARINAALRNQFGGHAVKKSN